MTTTNDESEHIDVVVEKEISDAELLAELELEAEASINQTLDESVKLNETLNETLLNLNETLNPQNQTFDSSTAGELTSFQEGIITTGSGVSVALLVLLVCIFIIQFVRKALHFFRTQSLLDKVDNPLSEAHQAPAEEFTPISVNDPKSYAVYDTPFEFRDQYLAKQAAHAPPSVLKSILLNRAIKCIDRIGAIQRDGVGIRKNWNMDLLPKAVWLDFNAASKNIHREIDSVIQENQRYGFTWGKYAGDIFKQAREAYQIHIENKKRAMRNSGHGQIRPNIHQQNMSPPSARNFGTGFQAGYLESNKNKKLSRKEKKELRKRQKQEKQQIKQEKQYLEQNVRRRKPKPKFSNK